MTQEVLGCPCGCGAREPGHCWKTSEDTPCEMCGKVPCFYLIYGEWACCSQEHVRDLIAREAAKL